MSTPGPLLRWSPVILAAIGATTLHHGVPEPGDSTTGVIVGVLLTLVGVALLGYAITRQVRRHRTHPDAQVQELVLLLVLVVVVFAAGYYLLDRVRPGEVAGLDTRLDALYFTLSLLTTVGFGDVHAAGQAARVLVSVQLVFDVVFVAALGGAIVRWVREHPRDRDAATGDS